MTTPLAPATGTVPAALTLPDGRPAAAAWSLSPRLRHLNHGSFGAVPVAALEAQSALRAQMESEALRWFVDLPARLGAARAQVAPFLGVDVEELAFVPNASGGVSVGLANLPFPAGGEVLVTDHGYGAVVMGAERLARRHGGTVRTVHVPLAAGDDEAAAAVVAAMGPRTALVVLDHVTSPTARFLPVAAVTAAAHARGIPVLVDGAHVPLMLARPLDGLDCDVWVGNLHKYGCAPRGAGVLVARGPHVGDLNPLIDSWGADKPFPRRFDEQGTLDATSYLAAAAALETVEQLWGWDTVRSYSAELVSAGARLIADAFGELTGEDHRPDVGTPALNMRLVRLPGHLCLGPGGGNAVRDRVLRTLDVEGAFTAFDGHGFLRLSAHAYNTLDDYRDFAERCVPELLRWSRETA